MAEVPWVPLTNGVSLPQLGLGLYRVPPEATAQLVESALRAGYRLFDCASYYNNERGLAAALHRTHVPRDEIFVTSKVWNSDHGYDSTLRAFDLSLQRLSLEVLDLYLIHWPVPARGLFLETWRALEALYADGRVRAIGVCNFSIEHLQRLLEVCATAPAINQIELHPGLPQERIRAFHSAQGISTQAWSPLGRGPRLLELPEVQAIAREVNRSAAQVILRWHVQLGNLVIPKTARSARLRENLDVWDFSLTDLQSSILSRLKTPGRLGPNPDSMNTY